MAEPYKKNHVVPVLLLKQWVRPTDSCLTRFRRLANGELLTEPKSAGAAGYEERLYWTYEFDSKPNKELERDYFARSIETPAAVVHQRLLAGEVSNLTSDERQQWTRFLIAQWIRTRQFLRTIEAQAAQDIANDTTPVPAGILSEDQPPLPLNELIERHLPHEVRNRSRKAIPTIVESANLNEAINASEWSIRSLHHKKLDLLIGDEPILTFGAPKGDFVLVLPISPSALFIACNTPQYLDRLNRVSTESLIKEANKATVQRAYNEVYAANTKNEPLVARYLGHAPNPPTIDTPRSR